MEGTEPELELKAVEKPKMREMVIETDGAAVNIKKTELTPLEVKEICRMLLKQLGG
jgi:hypothetical protein